MKTKINPIAYMLIMAGFSYNNDLLAKKSDYIFDSAYVNGSDVTRFNDGQQLPGKYLVTVSVNEQRKKVGSYKVNFEYRGETLTPVLNKEKLALFGINPDKLKLTLSGDGNEIDFDRSDVKFNFSFYGMNLTLYVPSKALVNKTSELAHESQWDDGINAFILNYDAKAWHRDVNYDSPDNESYYLSLNPGMNVGSWRVRHSGIWRKGYDGESSYQKSYTYAERDIRALKSKILIGESSTGSDIFGSVPFNGVKLASSDDMVPYYDRAFVPAIRGIANSVAQVEVRQNGYLIYSTEVPAGTFELTDVPAAQGETLDVTVREDNGAEQHFSVPYNTPAISLKEGRLKYELTGGTYRPYSRSAKDDSFGQATLIYGFNDTLTGYTGLQVSEKYQSGAAGLGFNLYDYGAVSVDGIYSKNRYSENKTGSAFRVRYNKLIDTTNTSFALASYQYASRSYSTFDDAMELGQSYSSGKRKNDFSISIRQELSDYGNLNLSYSKTTFWDKKDESYANLNYDSSLFGYVGFSLGWSRVLEAYRNTREDIYSATFSIPLSRFTGRKLNANMRYQIINERDNSVSNSLSLNGNAYENRLSWNISQGTNSRNHNNNRTSANASFKHSFGTVNGMYNYSPFSTQFGGGMNGSVILHEHGLTFGQPVYDSAALVDTNGESGIKITNKSGVQTDNNGYAVVTPLNTYRMNDISIKQARLQSKSDFKQTVTSVVPTSKALVYAGFKSVTGEKGLFKLKDKNDKPLPFGAMVSVIDQDNAGVIGDEGQVYLSGLKESGVIKVRWGSGINQTCSIPYALGNKNSAGLYVSTFRCQ